MALIPFFVIFLLLCALAPDSVGWADTPEFPLTAFYLDIIHPPGAPLYSILSNLLSLIPIGPIVWRVHIFSCLLSVGCMALVAKIALGPSSRNRPITLGVLCTAPLLPLLIPAWWRQSVAPEVYSLNCLLLLALVYLGERAWSRRDARALFLCAFISGLSLGNHISAALFVFPLAGALAFRFRTSPRSVAVSVLFGLIGLLVLLYLPVRSHAFPPLNTGQPDSLLRFWNLLSDARDRMLRPEALAGIAGLDGGSIAHFLARLLEDVRNVLSETGLWVASVGAVGLVLVTARQKFLGVLLGILCLSNLYFFHGWQVEVYLPVFAVLWVGVLHLLALLQLQAPRGAILFATILLGVSVYRLQAFSDQIVELRRDRSAELVGKLVLESLPQDSLGILEPSWFLAKYLWHIEGVRPDVTLTAVPQLAFPDYFAEVRLSFPGDGAFRSFASGLERSELGVFPSLIQMAPQSLPIMLEPSLALSKPLRKVAQLQASGMLRVERGTFVDRKADFGALCATTSKLIAPLGTQASNQSARTQIESLCVGMAQHLIQLEEYKRALNLLYSICPASSVDACSPQVLKIQALLMVSLRQWPEAQTLLQYLLVRRPDSDIISNLRYVHGQLERQETPVGS